MTTGVLLAGVGGAEVLPYPFFKIAKKCTVFGKNPHVVFNMVMVQISHLKGYFKSI